MKGHGSQYERKREAAISALLTQRSIEDAARVIGVGFSTLRRWMRIPEFDAAYRQALRDAMSQSIARLQQNSGAAVSTTLKIMVDPNAPASCRLRAADRVLEHGLRGMEVEDIQARVSALERGANPGPVHELGGFNDSESDFETDKAA
jgi:transposase-like protein